MGDVPSPAPPRRDSAEPRPSAAPASDQAPQVAPSTAHVADADVATERAARYAGQLASHLGRKLATTRDGDAHVVHFDDGACRLVPGTASLRLEACASTGRALARVQHVVGDHLERFGARDQLVVAWRHHEA